MQQGGSAPPDVVVARSGSQPMLEMWAELLGAQDIACRIVPAGLGDTTLVPERSVFELRVRAIDAQRALEELPAQATQASTPTDALPAEPADEQSLRGLMRLLVVAGIVFLMLFALVVLVRGLG